MSILARRRLRRPWRSDAGDIEDASVTAGTLTVTDSIDTTTITLNATSSITEAGGDVIYTLSGGSDAAGAVITFTDIVGGTQTLTLDAAGNATATVTVAADEDSIIDASSFTVTDAAVTNAGNLEAAAIDATGSTTTIADTLDTTTVALSATASVSGGQVDVVTYTATLTNAAGTGGVMVTTIQGIIAIAEGQTEGTLVINSPASVANTIDAVSNNGMGAGSLGESVVIDSANDSVTTLPMPSVTLDADITSDDIINAAEESTNIAITGTVGGDAADGDGDLDGE